MYNILKLICEILSRKATKIRVLWDRKHGVYAASLAPNVTSWYARNGMQKLTSVILYMNIMCTCMAQWLLGANFEILHCYTCFRDVTFF